MEFGTVARLVYERGFSRFFRAGWRGDFVWMEAVPAKKNPATLAGAGWNGIFKDKVYD